MVPRERAEVLLRMRRVNMILEPKSQRHAPMVPRRERTSPFIFKSSTGGNAVHSNSTCNFRQQWVKWISSLDCQTENPLFGTKKC